MANYQIDFIRPSLVVIPVMQSDNGRGAKFDLYMDGQAYNPMTDTGAETDAGMFRIDYRKSDGTKGSYDTLPDDSQAYHVSGSTIDVRWAPQMLTAAGKVMVNVVMQNVETAYALRSFTVILDVHPAAVPDDMTSEDYYNIKTLAQISAYLDAMHYLRYIGSEITVGMAQSQTFSYPDVRPSADIRVGDYVEDKTGNIAEITGITMLGGGIHSMTVTVRQQRSLATTSLVNDIKDAITAIFAKIEDILESAAWNKTGSAEALAELQEMINNL